MYKRLAGNSEPLFHGKVRKGVELSDYNGWDNKFTWLVHLHLSNEERLMNEIADLVASEPNEGAAGRLVEMWVKVALTNWLTRFPGRNKQHDESLLLFVWDLVGSALAYADWIALVAVLVGEAHTSDNLFTMTMYRNILTDRHFQQSVRRLVHEASNLYVGADGVKNWFEVQVDAWVAASATRQRKDLSISKVVAELIENTYTLIAWEHVARAFRPGY
jgi:hypothetical protein